MAGEEGTAFKPEHHIANLEWVSANHRNTVKISKVCHLFMSRISSLKLMENDQADLNGTFASFEHLSVSCHSAGCGPTLHLALNFTTLIKVCTHGHIHYSIATE